MLSHPIRAPARSQTKGAIYVRQRLSIREQLRRGNALSHLDYRAAPIAKTKCCASLEARGNGQHATRLVRTHHLRNLLGIADVVDLSREVLPPQCHAQQELHSG